MAAPMKRQHDEKNEIDTNRPCDEENEIATKRPRESVTESCDNEQLQKFLKWCEENNFKLTSKVTVQKKGSCAQYGMIALDDLPEGYCLFQVPRSCLLSPENTTISKLLEDDASKLDVQNKWIPLLLSLIHEHNDPNSKWRPYLDLVPDNAALDLPLFWDRSSIQNLLTNSKVDDAVTRDLSMIQNDFDNHVKPFFQRHPAIGNDLKDLEHFKKMVAFVMAYSFTEPMERKKRHNGKKDGGDDTSDDDDDEDEQKMSPPMMVPMADMLNHVTKHNAKLTFGTEALKMVTIRNISKGEEIFNTYGEVSNLHLMHMYGFTERFPDNFHDVVEIPAERLLEAARQMDGQSDIMSALLDKKWKFLKDLDMISDDEVFVLNKDGIITDDICIQVLKVLCMNESEFADYQEKDGWSDAESESSLSGDSRLSFEKIPTLDDKWILLLKRMAEIHVGKYHKTLTEDRERLKQLTALSNREKYSLFLIHGQKMLLQEFIDICDDSDDCDDS